jgi:Tol biopolymer transport system component
MALTAIGRTADGAWISASTAEGLSGWIPTDRLVLFGLDYLPILGEQVMDAQMGDTDSSVAGDNEETAASVSSSLVTEDTARLDATVATTGQRLNIRAGPGTDYPVITKAPAGRRFTAMGRNPNGDWILVEQPDLPGGLGWASARYLDLAGSASELPVSETISEAPALPAPREESGTDTGLTGKLVFQERSGGTIYVYDLTSQDLYPLTTGSDPAISPDGQTVAFWRGGGEHNLYLIDIDGCQAPASSAVGDTQPESGCSVGSNERTILTRGESIRAPTWSPDGQWLAFSRITGKTKCRHVGHGICVPNSFPYDLLFPVKLFDEWGLSRVDRSGDQFRDLPTLTNAISPDWNEGGIVYQSDGIQITADDPANGEHRSVFDEYRYQDPDWQASGGRIVFSSLEKDHREIFAVNPDGSNLVALTRPSSTLYEFPQNVAPAWSPDGQHIVFLSDRSGQWALWVMDADGSNQRQLPIDVPIEYNYQAEQVVSWGP